MECYLVTIDCKVLSCVIVGSIIYRWNTTSMKLCGQTDLSQSLSSHSRQPTNHCPQSSRLRCKFAFCSKWSSNYLWTFDVAYKKSLKFILSLFSVGPRNVKSVNIQLIHLRIFDLPPGFLSLRKEEPLPELSPQTPVSGYSWPRRTQLADKVVPPSCFRSSLSSCPFSWCPLCHSFSMYTSNYLYSSE